MNPIICSYASKGREDYEKGLVRLKDSVALHWKWDTHFHSVAQQGELQSALAFPHRPHNECPYFFKFTIIQQLREKGYKQIFWLDSSLVLEKDITPLLKYGVMAFDCLGHPLYKYISDKAVSNLLCSTYLHDIKQIWGGAIGFDFNKVWVNELFDNIIHQANIGSFDEGKSTREEFVAHRHDQATMSVLFHDANIPLIPYGKIVTHPHYLPPYEYGEDFYISHRPIL